MHVEHKDRTDDISQVDIALRMVGLNVDYIAADLIKTTLDKVREVGDDFSVLDAAKLNKAHELKWELYAKIKKDTTDE